MKGTKYTKAKALAATPADIKTAARKSKVSPLEYMLAVMNDESEDAQMRARMAIAAAPYVHSRAKWGVHREGSTSPGRERRGSTTHDAAGFQDGCMGAHRSLPTLSAPDRSTISKHDV
ncbi:hypothetical protein ASC90_20475 [Rhizobium sp. Root1220]|nr:hypothetical protein ASC90_20475 [Rhizobium sp. Root1220]